MKAADVENTAHSVMIENTKRFAPTRASTMLAGLPDGPNHAPFLTRHEKDFIAARLALEDGSKPTETGAAFSDARIFALARVLFVILGAIYGLLLWLPQIVQAIGFPPLPRLLPPVTGKGPDFGM
jgi:hypothetical protein